MARWRWSAPPRLPTTALCLRSPSPTWVTGGLAVLGALAAPISVLAGNNVQDESQAAALVDDDVPPLENVTD